jgi:hypothetical protein
MYQRRVGDYFFPELLVKNELLMLDEGEGDLLP